MTDYRAQIDELQMEANCLPDGPTALALLEEAVRIADSHNDTELGYELRQDLIRTATFSGRHDVSMVAFAWCVAQYDRNPENYDEHDLLWKYKWIVGNSSEVHTISRQQIEGLLADMERRYQAGGHSLYAVKKLRRDILAEMRDIDGALEANGALATVQRDSLSDCPACVYSGEAEYYEVLGDYEKQYQARLPMVQGRLSCAEEPLRSISDVLLLLLRQGKPDEAMALQKRSARRLSPIESHCKSAGKHILFLTLVGETARAKKLFEQFFPVGNAAVSGLHRLAILRAGLVLCDKLAQTRATIKMRLPDDAPPADDKGEREIATLRAWLDKEARALAAKFDARNGNDGETRRIDQLPELFTLAK